MKTIAARLILGGVFSAVLAGTVNAQTYPSRPITAIIPFAGGSASDVVSRIMLERMSKSMGQPIIVENRPGAGGNSGTLAAARATPDGYTLVGAGSGPIAANISLYKNLGYDPQKELAMISPFAGFTIVVVASTNAKINSLKELVARAKANPGTLNYGSVGIGSSQHLAGEYFAQVTGTKLTHVPYRNIAQYGPDLIAGTVPLGFQWFPNVVGSDPGRRREGARGRRRPAPRRAAGYADDDRSRPARIQDVGLVRAGGARRHAAADPRTAQQGTDRGAERSRGAAGLREGRRGADRALARCGEEIPRRRDRALPRRHHQGRHSAD